MRHPFAPFLRKSLSRRQTSARPTARIAALGAGMLLLVFPPSQVAARDAMAVWGDETYMTAPVLLDGTCVQQPGHETFGQWPGTGTVDQGISGIRLDLHSGHRHSIRTTSWSRLRNNNLPALDEIGVVRGEIVVSVVRDGALHPLVSVVNGPDGGQSFLPTCEPRLIADIPPAFYPTMLVELRDGAVPRDAHGRTLALLAYWLRNRDALPFTHGAEQSPDFPLPDGQTITYGDLVASVIAPPSTVETPHILEMPFLAGWDRPLVLRPELPDGSNHSLQSARLAHDPDSEASVFTRRVIVDLDLDLDLNAAQTWLTPDLALKIAAAVSFGDGACQVARPLSVAGLWFETRCQPEEIGPLRIGHLVGPEPADRPAAEDALWVQELRADALSLDAQVTFGGGTQGPLTGIPLPEALAGARLTVLDPAIADFAQSTANDGLANRCVETVTVTLDALLTGGPLTVNSYGSGCSFAALAVPPAWVPVSTGDGRPRLESGCLNTGPLVFDAEGRAACVRAGTADVSGSAGLDRSPIVVDWGAGWEKVPLSPPEDRRTALDLSDTLRPASPYPHGSPFDAGDEWVPPYHPRTVQYLDINGQPVCPAEPFVLDPPSGQSRVVLPTMKEAGCPADAPLPSHIHTVFSVAPQNAPRQPPVEHPNETGASETVSDVTATVSAGGDGSRFPDIGDRQPIVRDLAAPAVITLDNHFPPLPFRVTSDLPFELRMQVALYESEHACFRPIASSPGDAASGPTASSFATYRGQELSAAPVRPWTWAAVFLEGLPVSACRPGDPIQADRTDVLEFNLPALVRPGKRDVIVLLTANDTTYGNLKNLIRRSLVDWLKTVAADGPPFRPLTIFSLDGTGSLERLLASEEFATNASTVLDTFKQTAELSGALPMSLQGLKNKVRDDVSYIVPSDNSSRQMGRVRRLMIVTPGSMVIDGSGSLEPIKAYLYDRVPVKVLTAGDCEPWNTLRRDDESHGGSDGFGCTSVQEAQRAARGRSSLPDLFADAFEGSR